MLLRTFPSEWYLEKNLILIRIQISHEAKQKIQINYKGYFPCQIKKKNLYLEFVRHHIIFVSPYFHLNFRNPFTESNLYNYQIPPFIYSYHNAQLSGVPIEFTCDVLAVHWSTSEVDPLQDVLRLFITILEIDFSSFELNKIMKIKYIKYIIDYSSFTLHAEKRLNERSHNTFYSIFINRKNNKYISKTSTVYNAVFYNEMNHFVRQKILNKNMTYIFGEMQYTML